MSRIQPPEPAQLMCSLLSSDWEAFWPDLRQELEDRWGRLDWEAGPLAFTETSYYDAELGTPIQRRLLGFEPLKDPGALAGIKWAMQRLEERYLRSGGRRLFNLDPGLVFLERLVLATGKNHTHRIYLSQGVWADLTLIYHQGGWRTLPWTYPDYAGTVLQDHLTRLRQHYKAKLDRLRTAKERAC